MADPDVAILGEDQDDETGEAIDRYNALASSGQRVGGLFHTTC